MLDAKDWFANFNHLKKPQERQNDFGGVFGGPISKNKTFFFFSYEGLRVRQPSTQQTNVPCDSTCLVFGNARAMAMPAMQPFLNAYSIPNGPEVFKPCNPNVNGCPAFGQQPTGLAEFNSGYSNPSSLDAYSIRFDQALSSKLSLFGRYDHSPSSFGQRGPFSGSQVLSTTESLSSTANTLTLGLTAPLKPGMSNEVRANYSNDRVSTKFALDNFGGAVPLADSLLFPSGFSSTNSAFELLILGAGEIATGKFGISEQRQVNLVDNLSLTTGGHQLKFGVDYRWLSPFTSPFAYAQFAEFSGVAATPGGALSGNALIGESSASQGDALLSRNFSFYGQDTWKITPRLTVTYGLRWDINPPLKGKHSANDPFTVVGLSDPATMTLAPRGTPLYQTTYRNVAPRVGLACQLRGIQSWTAVLRAGFGIFYDLGSGSLGGVSSYFPYSAFKLIPAAPFPLSPTDAAPPTLSTNPPVSTMVVADPHLKLPRTYQWNVALEQSLGSNQSLSITYIGADGRDLLRATNLFNPNSDFQFVSVTSNTAASYYHALQVKFQRRLSRGLQGLASYSFSHSIDTASTDAFANYLNTPGGGTYQNADRGDSDFDIRHSFTAGVTYDLPAPKEQKIVHSILNGWSLDSFVIARSAPPVDVVGAIYFSAGTALYPRPNLISGVSLELFGSQYPGGKIFNSAAFTTPPVGQQGNFGRNVLRGFGATQLDFALQRQFHVTEKVAFVSVPSFSTSSTTRTSATPTIC